MKRICKPSSMKVPSQNNSGRGFHQDRFSPPLLCRVRIFLSCYSSSRILLDFHRKALRGFERRHLVRRNFQGRPFGYVAGRFLGSQLEDERPETAEVDGLSADHILFNTFHELFDHRRNNRLFLACRFGDFRYDFCFCHKPKYLCECDTKVTTILQ